MNSHPDSDTLQARKGNWRNRGIKQEPDRLSVWVETSLRLPTLSQDGLILYISLNAAGESTHPSRATCMEAWTYNPRKLRKQKPSIFEPMHQVSPEYGLLLAPGSDVYAGFYNNLRQRTPEELNHFIMHLHRDPDKDLYRTQVFFNTSNPGRS